MKQRQLLSCLFALLASITAHAYDFEIDGIYYTITSTTNRTVSVTFAVDGTNNANYYSGNINIPASVSNNGINYTVSAIGDGAFYRCSELSSITIPNSVTSIGESVFFGSGLTSIDIPNSVTSIGDAAFYGCSHLQSVTIPNSVTEIGVSTFNSCSNLVFVIIPNNVTSIGERSFQYCTNLIFVRIPGSVTTIGDYAFADCSNLTSVIVEASTPISLSSDYIFPHGAKLYVPNEMEVLSAYRNSNVWKEFSSIQGYITLFDFERDGLFYNITSTTNNSVEVTNCVNGTITAEFYSGDVSIPANISKDEITYTVTAIGEYAYSDCSGLTSVIIPNTITAIDQYAFQGCTGLTSVTIPSSVTTFAYMVFGGCNNLNNISVDVGNSVYDSRDNCNAVIETSSNKLITGCKNTVIPKSVTTIGPNAFYRCTDLTSVTIPNSVTTIGPSAFSGCTGLASVTIPESVTSIGEGAFNGCSGLASVKSRIESPIPIGDYTFNNISSSCVLTVPAGTRDAYIAAGWTENIFQGGIIEEATPNIITATSVEGIEMYFLVTSNSPKEVQIGDGKFSYDESSIHVTQTDTGILTVPGEVEGYTVTSIGTAAFDRTSFSKIILPNTVRKSGDCPFEGAAVQELHIPASLTDIPERFLFRAFDLESVTVDPDNPVYDSRDNCNGIIETASNRLICGCKSTVIPNTVTTLGGWSFFEVTLDHELAIPASVLKFENTPLGGNPFARRSPTLRFLSTDPVSTEYSSQFDSGTLIYVPEGYETVYTDQYPSWNIIITFADPAVETLCLANWDDNNDGVLTMVEAAAVTSLGEVLKNNTEITSFDELQYFTGLTEIGSRAFERCSGLTSITIPEGVTSIGEGAFGECRGLTSLSIPNSVTSIDSWAFNACTSLTSMTIPNSVTSISHVFENCPNLTSIVVEEGNPVYDSRENCNAIIETSTNTLVQGCKNTTIPNSVTSIGTNAFGGSWSMNTVTIPNSITTIESYAFNQCISLAQVISQIETPFEFGEGAFDNIPDNCVLTIPVGTRDAYIAAGWTEEIFRGGIMEMGMAYLETGKAYTFQQKASGLFMGLSASGISLAAKSNAAELYFEPGENGGFYLKTDDGMYVGMTGADAWTMSTTAGNKREWLVGYLGDNYYMIYKPSNANDHIGTNDNEVNVGDPCYADKHNSDNSYYLWKIEEVDNTPINFADPAVEALCLDNWDDNNDGVLTMVEASAVTSLGKVFKGNTEITSFDELQYFTGLTDTPVPVHFALSTWKTSAKYDNIVITSDGTTLYQNDFSIESLTDWTNIGGGQWQVINGALCQTNTSMEGNGNLFTLNSLTLGNNYTIDLDATKVEGDEGFFIGFNVADGSNYCRWNIGGWVNTKTQLQERIDGNLTDVGNESSQTVENGRTYHITIAVNNGNVKCYLDGELIHDYNFTVLDLKGTLNNAFERCSGLTNVSIPEGVTSIGNYAFYGCSSLTSITIPESVTSIGNSAFEGCSNLTSVSIPESVTTIGEYAFSGCSSLTSVTIPNSVTTINREVFHGCSSLTSVTIPESVTSIGKSAFYGCSSLTSITIPESVTSIDEWTFGECKSLTSVTIPNSVTSILTGAFWGCI